MWSPGEGGRAGSRLVNPNNISKDMIDKEKERERGALVTSLASVGLSANP